MRYQSRRLEAGVKCKKCAHLRLQHKNSSKLLKIATSLCLYLLLASRGPLAKHRRGGKKVFISLLNAARCSSSCFAQFFFFFLSQKKCEKKTATQIIIASLMLCAVCCFFSLMVKKLQKNYTLNTHKPRGVRLS